MDISTQKCHDVVFVEKPNANASNARPYLWTDPVEREIHLTNFGDRMWNHPHVAPGGWGHNFKTAAAEVVELF